MLDLFDKNPSPKPTGPKKSNFILLALIGAFMIQVFRLQLEMYFVVLGPPPFWSLKPMFNLSQEYLPIQLKDPGFWVGTLLLFMLAANARIGFRFLKSRFFPGSDGLTSGSIAQVEL